MQLFLEDISPFYGSTDTPVLDFWWRLPWVSKPWWSLACLLHCLCAMDSWDSALVWHLLTSWQSARRPNHFFHHVYIYKEDCWFCGFCFLQIDGFSVFVICNTSSRYLLCIEDTVPVLWCRKKIRTHNISFVHFIPTFLSLHDEKVLLNNS